MSSFSQETPITDREIALKRLGGDQKLLATLAGFFLEDAPAFMAQLMEAYHAGDLETVFRRAHSLKGLSATFEAVPFVQLAVEVESLARARDELRLNNKITELKVEFDRLVEHLASTDR